MDNDTPRAPPLSADDLERVRANALRMVGNTRLQPEGQPLTWSEVRHWDSCSAQDALSLVDEVEHLRTLLAVAVIHVYDAAYDELLGELERRNHGRAWAHDWLGRQEYDDG